MNSNISSAGSQSQNSHSMQSENPTKTSKYPYTEFDLLKAKQSLCHHFGIESRAFREIIELVMKRINGQFHRNDFRMKPQMGLGETVAITDKCIADQLGYSKATVAKCRRSVKKTGLWDYKRASGKHGDSRCGVWIYLCE